MYCVAKVRSASELHLRPVIVPIATENSVRIDVPCNLVQNRFFGAEWLGTSLLPVDQPARIFGKFLASGFFDEGKASEESENHRINTG